MRFSRTVQLRSEEDKGALETHCDRLVGQAGGQPKLSVGRITNEARKINARKSKPQAERSSFESSLCTYIRTILGSINTNETVVERASEMEISNWLKGSQAKALFSLWHVGYVNLLSTWLQLRTKSSFGAEISHSVRTVAYRDKRNDTWTKKQQLLRRRKEKLPSADWTHTRTGGI